MDPFYAHDVMEGKLVRNIGPNGDELQDVVLM